MKRTKSGSPYKVAYNKESWSPIPTVQYINHLNGMEDLAWYLMGGAK